ncbi:MAG: type II toxin-antitoxin system RelE/ParE family toxin [Pyrinomonadaceae bacterium]|nr:type II toxin-antitoxin system RelE/ParE family toxin [Pyrinomonadaceae bacterium]MBP6211890.1 type II toxin-antitoxin system RelE/ParE family toxin [Pyrinomonadaceae bacterium]
MRPTRAFAVNFTAPESQTIYDDTNRTVKVRKQLDQIDSATTLDDLRIPPGNRLEALRADRAGQYSIRINDQFRICFEWIQNRAANVEVVDYH